MDALNVLKITSLDPLRAKKTFIRRKMGQVVYENNSFENNYYIRVYPVGLDTPVGFSPYECLGNQP